MNINLDFTPNFHHTGRDEEKGEKLIHSDETMADSHFHWVSQDRSLDLAFSQSQKDALNLASQYDLCVTGTGLAHLHKTGADLIYIPLAQVSCLHPF